MSRAGRRRRGQSLAGEAAAACSHALRLKRPCGLPAAFGGSSLLMSRGGRDGERASQEPTGCRGRVRGDRAPPPLPASPRQPCEETRDAATAPGGRDGAMRKWRRWVSSGGMPGARLTREPCRLTSSASRGAT